MNQRPHLSEIILNWKQSNLYRKMKSRNHGNAHKRKDLTLCSSGACWLKKKQQPQRVCLSLCFNLANCLLEMSQSLMQAWNFMERPLHQANHLEGATQRRQQGKEAAVVDKHAIIRRASRSDSGAPTSSLYPVKFLQYLHTSYYISLWKKGERGCFIVILFFIALFEEIICIPLSPPPVCFWVSELFKEKVFKPLGRSEESTTVKISIHVLNSKVFFSSKATRWQCQDFKNQRQHVFKNFLISDKKKNEPKKMWSRKWTGKMSSAS